MKQKIYILGVGHNTPVCIDLAIACNYEIVGLYHYNNSRSNQIDHGFPILGSFDDLFNSNMVKGNNFVLSMGDNKIRSSLCKRIIEAGGHVPTLIHPNSVVSAFTKISNIGVQIFPYVNIMADTEIGEDTIILSHSVITHSTKIGNHCYISLNVVIGAYTCVEDFVDFGMGALSISGKVNVIGHHSFIGARSLITKDIPSYSLVLGSPARIVGRTLSESK